MISIDERDPSAVIGHLLVERRVDPTRRSGEPPVVAEVRGETRAEVLASLRALAESESALGERLEAWVEARRGSGITGITGGTSAASAGGGNAGGNSGAGNAGAAGTGTWPTMPAPSAHAGTRVRMPDGTWWSVERRHETTQLSLGPALAGGAPPRDRALFLFFHGGDGALRRVAIPEELPERPDDAELWSLWERAVVVR